MNIETIVVGRLQANCYLIEKDAKLIVVDPGAEYQKIKSAIKNRQVVAIFITHKHPDHIGVLKELLNDYQVPINPGTIEGFEYEIIMTPGHSKDSITFYFPKEKIMFTGDFIFNEDIGRTDFIGGNKKEMVESLRMISEYPDDIIMYPGHEEKTILEHEKKRFSQYY